MKSLLRKLSVVLVAGAFGGVVNDLVIWLFDAVGLLERTGVAISGSLVKSDLYMRIIWGGIWGLLFVLPMMKRSVWLRGMVFSLAPTLVQLLIVFPLRAEVGWFGLDLGGATPVFVFLFNLAWGIAAAAWVVGARGDRIDDSGLSLDGI
ncbi:MAG: hypothetical protein ACOCXX_01515 [Planctomycetota bacterium]